MNELHLLFLCTGNSCRSQMAEGWARHLSTNRLQVQSAGIEAHGKNPRAIAVMQEVGIDITDQESTSITPEMLEWADLVVTVCGHADEHCPTLPSGIEKQHWPLKDPAKSVGTEGEIHAMFQASCDEIRRRVALLLSELEVKK